MTRDQLIASGQALLDLDARGALVPHGIGGHAREIIEGFIALAANPMTATPSETHEAALSDERLREIADKVQPMIDWMRALVDNQEGGDAVILVQRQQFNKIVGLLHTLAQVPQNEALARIHKNRADELERRSATTQANWQPLPTALAALQKIADLPSATSEEIAQGREDAYRAIEGMFKEPPRIEGRDPVTTQASEGADTATEWAKRKDEVILDYRRGNLTKLGVANNLRRAGFRLDVAVQIANELPEADAAPQSKRVERLEGDPLRVALDESQGLLVAMLHESRPRRSGSGEAR